MIKIEETFSLLPLPSHASIAPLGKVTNLSGLHIIANFVVTDRTPLADSTIFKNFIDKEIKSFGLTQVGEIYHSFANGGFTAVVCLTESHISIHTWPESSYLTFDIFLSNYLKDNTDITTAIYQHLKTFLNASVVFEQTIKR